MADNTGAPWLLPYPEDTDLVRDGASDIEALAVAAASGLTAANTGIGTNVISTTKVDTFTTTNNAATGVEITGLTATITPTTNTSKVLVIARVTISAVQVGALFLARGGTQIGGGTAVGSRRSASVGRVASGTAGGAVIQTHTLMQLDSPATTSATTYSVRVASVFADAVNINRSDADTDANSVYRTSSTITVIEVAA